jgi:hypothetical protein
MTAIDPRFKAPIASSAASPAPFVPLSLDPLRRLAQELPFLEQNVGSLRDAGEDEAADAALIEINNRRRIADEEAMRMPPPPEFQIRTPTPLERDQLSSRLLELGLTNVSQEQIRASMIEALYEIDWAAEGDDIVADEERLGFNEGRAEEHATFLDGIWQREDVQVTAYAKWREQETERVLDRLDGAPEREATPMPTRIVSVRDEARARLLADRLLETPRMRRLVAKQIDFGRRNAMLIARINLLGVISPVLSPFAPDPVSNLVAESDVERMRGELAAAYGAKLAGQAWVELVDRIDTLYRLDEFETGNFDSPLEKPSDPTGSTGPSGDIATSGGPSTTSCIEALPADESVTITDKSSGSSSASAEPSEKPIQTAEA